MLARLARSVVALEQDPALARHARRESRGGRRDNVTVVTGPLTQGWAAAGPYDVIFLDGATEVVPQALFRQLKEGGRLVAVVGRAPPGQAMLYRAVGGDVSGWPIFDAAAPLLPGFAAPRLSCSSFGFRLDACHLAANHHFSDRETLCHSLSAGCPSVARKHQAPAFRERRVSPRVPHGLSAQLWLTLVRSVVTVRAPSPSGCGSLGARGVSACCGVRRGRRVSRGRRGRYRVAACACLSRHVAVLAVPVQRMPAAARLRAWPTASSAAAPAPPRWKAPSSRPTRTTAAERAARRDPGDRRERPDRACPATARASPARRA